MRIISARAKEVLEVRPRHRDTARIYTGSSDAFALVALRTGAAAMVVSLPDNKGVTGDQLTASYDNQLALPMQQMNTVMIIKTRAQQACWTEMDPTSRGLITTYFASVAGQ